MVKLKKLCKVLDKIIIFCYNMIKDIINGDNMGETKWYEKVFAVIANILKAVWKGIKVAFNWFISVFNSWHKLAAIFLALFAWNWLVLPFVDKIGAFILFGVLALLVFDIAKEK